MYVCSRASRGVPFINPTNPTKHGLERQCRQTRSPIFTGSPEGDPLGAPYCRYPYEDTSVLVFLGSDQYEYY